jgi:hypothetical protein
MTLTESEFLLEWESKAEKDGRFSVYFLDSYTLKDKDGKCLTHINGSSYLISFPKEYPSNVEVTLPYSIH